MEDMPNTPEELRERYQELQEAYQGTVKLHLAAENMLDNLFNERLAANNLLPIGPKGDHLLVETSYFQPPIDFRGTIKHIQEQGYTVILAHPERYRYMEEGDYEYLVAQKVKESGAQIVYSWTEDKNGLPEGWSLTDTSINGTLTTLTNTYAPGKTSVPVEKIWNDNGNSDGTRPDKVTVRLEAKAGEETIDLAAEGVVTDAELSEANHWKHI